MAPFRNLDLGDEVLEDESPIVIVISWGEGDRNSVAYATVLNENGEIIDVLKMQSLADRDNKEDVDKLINVIAQHSPEVLVVGGFKPNTKSQLLKLVQEAEANGRQFEKKWEHPIPAVIVEDEIARLYMNSKRGLADFPEKDYPMLVRYCVALGRKTQSPTLAFASLYNADEDFRAIRLHPLQHLIPEDNLKSAVERAFINVVNQCGVDINAAASFSHLSHSLQFVSGLGPRKAQAFISKIIRSGGRLESRNDLIRKNLCGSKIFVNCSSFIRIRAHHFTATYRETTFDVLDDTRIHPEDYALARKMAADALDIDETDEDNPSHFVQELMEGDIERLNLLMLDDYAVELERQTHQPKRLCLNDIKDELTHPFKDKRQFFEPATDDEIFTMLTGENQDTIKEGVVISASIGKAFPKFLKCKLPSGLDGIIFYRELGVSEGQEELAAKQYPPHTALQCVVIKVDKERLQVELSAQIHMVEQANAGLPRDPFFSQPLELEDAEEEQAKTRKSKERQTRQIAHPFFQNLDYRKAEAYLAGRNIGDVVVRPSTKGNNHFSLTWKVLDDVYQHLDNEWSLGKKLKIDELEFNEIDQIIAEYIEPMTRRIKKLVQHAKFQRKSLHEISAYGFIIIPDKPGTFYLVFKHPANSKKYEYVIVKPSGYLFRKKLFITVDELLDSFKANEAEKAQLARQAQQLRQQQSRPPPPPEGRMNADRMQQLAGQTQRIPAPPRYTNGPSMQRGYAPPPPPPSNRRY